MNSLNNFAQRLAILFLVAVAAPVAGAIGVVAVADSASAAVISTIQVVGNQRIESETIRTYVTIKPGKSFGAFDIDESIKALYDTGLFSDVSVAARGNALVVTVVENPIINSVNFEGNSKIKANVLVQVIESEPRGVMTQARLETDVRRIEDYYSRSGRSNATVQPMVTPLDNNRVDIVFVVTEGGRTGVANITFVGNSAFSSARLSRVIQTRTTNWLSWLNKRDVYSEETLLADQEALRSFYLQHGFADFQVLGADAAFDAAAGKYFITFTVDEGPKYSFGAINVDSSIPGVDGAALMRVVKTEPGRVFNARLVEKSVENLTIELSGMGYVFAQVRPRGDRDYTNNTIAITYVIDEGPRAYVERIEIRGNSKTRDYVIRREFDISEGDAYNRVLVARAERRLRDLGFFSTVEISTEPGSAPDKVVLVVFVQDQATGSLSVAAGVSTSDGFIAEIALEETNFLGRGQIVRISVGGGLDDRQYNLSFTDPYFLGMRVAAGFDLYRMESNAGSRPFSTLTDGGALRLGFELTDTLSAQLNYKLVNVDSDYGTSPATTCNPSDNTTLAGKAAISACYFPDASRLTSSVGYALTYSTLDSRLDPHDGAYLKLAQDFAGVGGDARYVRTTADARLYKPVLPDSDIIGMLRVHGGNVTGLGQPVAIADNFFKGGETVRGFASLGFGPRDTSPAGTGDGIAIGGKNYVAGTAEVTFPFPLLPPDFGLRGAVFADAGMLFGVDRPAVCTLPGCTFIDDTAIRSSIGGSVIWSSPFGIIRLDVAQALTKQWYDETQMFRLAAGTQF
jgi:outer membrane protein insertion porin family